MSNITRKIKLEGYIDKIDIILSGNDADNTILTNLNVELKSANPELADGDIEGAHIFIFGEFATESERLSKLRKYFNDLLEKDQ